jgi:uncharacterized protein YceK
MIHKKNILIGAASLLLVGCGTINTVFRDDAVTSSNLKSYRSYCESVPRVYSGVAYDFCVLNGVPGNQSDVASDVNSVPLIFFYDFLASGVFDTVLLPYTIYRQGHDGSIEIAR